MWKTFLLVLLLCPAIASAQAVWNGRTYNGRVCANPNCGMCASIQHQIEAQRAMMMAAPVPQPAPQATQAAYRTETTLEARTTQVKRCNGRQCWYETVTEMVPVTRQVPIAQPAAVASKPAPPAKPAPVVNTLANTELVPTPQAVVNAMLEELCPSNKAKLFDLGSGDGRVVITAAKQFGCTAVGIELNPETIAMARAAARLEPRAGRAHLGLGGAAPADPRAQPAGRIGRRWAAGAHARPAGRRARAGLSPLHPVRAPRLGRRSPRLQRTGDGLVEY